MGDALNTAVLEPPDMNMPIPEDNALRRRRRARRRPAPLAQVPAIANPGPVVPGMNAPGPEDQPPRFDMRVAGGRMNDNERMNTYVEEIVRQIPDETADNMAGPFPGDSMDADINNQELDDLEELLPHVNLDEHRDAIQTRIDSLIQYPRSTRARYPRQRIRRVLDQLQRGRTDAEVEMY